MSSGTAHSVVDRDRRYAVKTARYARVSTDRQAERGTIGSQMAVLREQVTAAGHELVAEYVDDGHSGARVDRPGLDVLCDAAEAGLFEAVWCLAPTGWPAPTPTKSWFLTSPRRRDHQVESALRLPAYCPQREQRPAPSRPDQAAVTSRSTGTIRSCFD
jgi:hypothetical protein